MRDVERQLDSVADTGRTALQELVGRTKRILSQKQKDKNKLYALHAPEVECLAKGKARTPYEFGGKVSITTTHKEGLVVGARSMPGNPYDGHTLAEALEQAAILIDVKPEGAFVDHGYKGVAVEGVKIYPPGIAARYHARAARDDSQAKRDRACHRSHEGGRQTCSELAQRRARRCDARGAVRRRPQPANDPHEAEVFYVLVLIALLNRSTATVVAT
jgi:IS5 family transposase